MGKKSKIELGTAPYFKIVVAVIFLEMAVGFLGYEYGYARGGEVYGVGQLYFLMFYALIYVVLCAFQIHYRDSLPLFIVSTIYLFALYLPLVILSSVNGIIEDTRVFAIAFLILLGIAAIFEIGELVIQIINKKRNQ